jgi:hypothetical protein
VAWIAVFDGHDADGEFVWPDKGRAMEWASARPGVTIAPLYLQLHPTDCELDAIRFAADTLCVGWDDLKPEDKNRSRKAAHTLRWMVARLS